MVSSVLLRNRIELKIEKILRNNQNGSRRNWSMISQIWTIHRILEDVRAKYLEATILFVDFSKAFDSIHRGKMEQILLAYSHPKKNKNDGDRLLQRCSRYAKRRPNICSSSAKTTCLERLLIQYKKTVSSWQRKEAEDTPHKQDSSSGKYSSLSRNPAT